MTSDFPRSASPVPHLRGVAQLDPHTRQPEIDWLKGTAILFVLLIHAKPLEGFWIHDHVINRAVPIFVVTFGITSQRWWSVREQLSLGDGLRSWYASRWRRLLIPAWATLAGWWSIALFSPLHATVSIADLPLMALGYWAKIGTGWFVTLIILLVLLYPFLELGIRATGSLVAVIVSAATLVASHASMFGVIEIMRVIFRDTAPAANPFFYFWIFPPAWLYAITVGTVLTRSNVRLRPIHAPLFAVLAWVAFRSMTLFGFATASNAAFAFADAPLALALLAALRIMESVPSIAHGLAWLGQWSWGLYLGQLLVHNALIAAGVNPLHLSPTARWGYFFCLLLGAVALAKIGEYVRERPAARF